MNDWFDNVLGAKSDRFRTALASPNSDAVIHRKHKDFAITDLASRS
jgi:hypothetical protein